jgi:hypothetical protein
MPCTFECVMQFIIGRASPSSTTPRAAVAMLLCANAATPTAGLFAASLIDCSPSPAPYWSGKHCLIPNSARRSPHKPNNPFVRSELTSLRPDLPLGRAPRASAVQDAATRHRRLAPARSVLDSASTVLCSICREVQPIPPASGVTAPLNSSLTIGRKSGSRSRSVRACWGL